MKTNYLLNHHAIFYAQMNQADGFLSGDRITLPAGVTVEILRSTKERVCLKTDWKGRALFTWLDADWFCEMEVAA